MQREDKTTSRREFLKNAGRIAVTSALVGVETPSVHAAGSDIIRVGLIGCGARGPGAAVNAMNVDPGARLVALTDIFLDKVQSRREMLRKERPKQVEVGNAHCFFSLDGYKHVIESVGVVLSRASGS
jgi:myo-inositol 2-dehydrogenase / D-chiro-inositol 1-dehydrogenase